VGTANLGAGNVTVQVGVGFTEVTFTDEVIPSVCVLTQGFFKNHPDAVTALRLGNTNLTPAQITNILKTPPAGNFLIQVEHQLIAALLNQGRGATAPADVQAAINAAQQLIIQQGGPGGTASPQTTVTVGGRTFTASQLVDILTAFNEGRAPGGPPHCAD
jgi:hypothetical protein